MIKNFNPPHLNDSRKILGYDPKIVDIKKITKLGLQMNDRLEIMTHTSVRPETPLTIQAFLNSCINETQLQKFKHEDFIVESETPEQSNTRYLFHIFQIEERKKLVVKERNRLKKEATKQSRKKAYSISPKVQIASSLDTRNYFTIDDQINIFKHKNSKEVQRIKANFVSKLEAELENKQKRNEHSHSSVKASSLKDKSDQEKITKAKNQNQHAFDIGIRQKQNEQKFYESMVSMKKAMITEENHKNQFILQNQKVITEQQSMKEDRELLKYTEVLSRRKLMEQEVLSKGDLILKNLNKKIEHSSFLNGQCVMERQQNLNKMLSKIEVVLSKAQLHDEEEIKKKITLAVEKGQLRTSPYPLIKVNAEILRSEKIKKNLQNLKQLDQIMIQKIEERLEAKDLYSDRAIIQKLNRNQEQHSNHKDRQLGCMRRYEQITHDHQSKCDQILEKERLDLEQMQCRTQKREAFREQVIAQSKLDNNRQKENLSCDLVKFSEKPSKGLLIKQFQFIPKRSLRKYDLNDEKLVEKFFPKHLTEQDE